MPRLVDLSGSPAFLLFIHFGVEEMVSRKIAKTIFIVSLLVAAITFALFANYLETKQRNNVTPSPQPSVTLTPSLSASSHPTISSSPTSVPTPVVTNLPSVRPSPSRPPTTPRTTLVLPPTPPPPILYPGEVTDYRGQNLASIAQVYENAIAGTQNISAATYALSVYGLVNNSLSLSYDNVITGFTHYQKVVNIYCVEGWNATILWEGILVKDLIAQAVPQTTAKTAIFYASDGYTTALPLNYLKDNNILLGYKMNGLVMPPERGFPFELVAESKYGYKWIKWVTGIELSNDVNYLGYWESRGYPNDAAIP